MVKYFCDVCKKQMTPNDNGRLKGKEGILEIEVMVSVNGVWNGGHVCHKCIVKAINELMDTEKP